jgi:hypothetical protein
MYGLAVEINAHPWRLDLDWRWHQKALDYGCTFSINPDAHSIRELDCMHWGVEMAQKGGVHAHLLVIDKTRRSHTPPSQLDAFSAIRSWADCTINMPILICGRHSCRTSSEWS